MGQDKDGKLKPSRSEADALTEAEEAKYAEQVQDFLKATNPVRALKPSRSDMEDSFLEGLVVPPGTCKEEMLRFKQLEAGGEELHTEGGTVNDDSYVETPYYDDLNSVDKVSHYRTGSGFIKSEDSELPFTVGDDEVTVFHTNKTNPATNEWEPSPVENQLTKPRVQRSESIH